MCGIFGYVGKAKKTAQLVIDGLKKLDYRGYDSWGIAVKKARDQKQKPKFLIERHVGKIGEGKVSPKLFFDSSIGIGHTRWATHGGVTEKNAHPHLDCSKTIAVVHNGIVENYKDLKNGLLQAGHKFLSETDTEVIPHLIEENLKTGKGFSTSVRDAFNKLSGLNAIVVANTVSREIIAAKNGSPLVVGIGKDDLFIASDAVAILEHTAKMIFLDDQEMAILGDGIKIIRLPKGEPIKKTPTTIGWKIEEAKRGKFPHFMLKEIFEQPAVLRRVLKDSSQIKDLAQIVDRAFGTYLVGCGSAAYACLTGQYLFSHVAKRHTNFAVGSEFTYLEDFLTPKSLVVALSQSGETIDIIESVEGAKEKGAKIVAMVNNIGSTLFRLADYKILLNAGPEKAVVATKSFTAKLANLILLSFSLKGKIGEGKGLLKKSTLETAKILTKKNLARIKRLVGKIYQKEHIYVIGRGLSHPIALEAALKIKETSYIHAEGFAAGELKHGVIALIEKGTPCLVFAPNDETYNATISGATEIKSRGGTIIGISHENNEIFDDFLPIGDCGAASVIPSVVIAQLLAYFLAVRKGLDPDKPRNLAKSVTVR